MNSSKLYVGNLSYSVNDEQLKELFSKHGEVKGVTLIAQKGFGFVEMANSADAEKAQEALNNTQWEGRTIKVDEARPPSAKKPRSGFQNRSRGFGDNKSSDRGFNSRGRNQNRGYSR